MYRRRPPRAALLPCSLAGVLPPSFMYRHACTPSRMSFKAMYHVITLYPRHVPPPFHFSRFITPACTLSDEALPFHVPKMLPAVSPSHTEMTCLMKTTMLSKSDCRYIAATDEQQMRKFAVMPYRFESDAIFISAHATLTTRTTNADLSPEHAEISPWHTWNSSLSTWCPAWCRHITILDISPFYCIDMVTAYYIAIVLPPLKTSNFQP